MVRAAKCDKIVRITWVRARALMGAYVLRISMRVAGPISRSRSCKLQDASCKLQVAIVMVIIYKEDRR